MSQIAANMRMVAEGVKTTEAVRLLGDRLGVDLPIADAIGRALADGTAPKVLVRELMTRALREE